MGENVSSRAQGVGVHDPAAQQELRTIFEKPKMASLSGPELRKREEELIKGALRAVELNNAQEKRKLEAELDKARRSAVQMQQQLDAMRQAEHLNTRGIRKPQHRHKFQVLALDKTYVWHQMLNHSSLGNQDPLLIVEGFGNRVWDANGKEYLDATSGGTWVVNVGCGRPSTCANDFISTAIVCTHAIVKLELAYNSVYTCIAMVCTHAIVQLVVK